MPDPTYPIVTSYDGQRITVDDYLKDPLRIPALVISLMANEFIMETVLRDAGGNDAGVVRFEKSVPLFANTNSTVRQEFSEVPATTANVGALDVAYSYERALAITVSDEMRRRQQIDPVNRQLTQVKNTMVRDWNNAFFALLNALIPTSQTYSVTATEAWDGTTVQQGITSGPTPGANIIRAHISDAVWLVENAAQDSQPNNFFEFEPDTIIIDHTAKLALFKSQDFAKPYLGDAASESIQFTGKLPNKIMNLDPLVSRQCPAGTAYVLQRNVLGFYSDELPTQATPLYRKEENKYWRSDVQRAAAMGLDQPKAICKLTGVTTLPGPAGGTSI